MGAAGRGVKPPNPRKINYPEDVVSRPARSTGCRQTRRPGGV